MEFTGTDRIAVSGRLGSGGFGVVYRGFDRERNLPVAIKTLKHLDAAGLGHLKEEFRSLADIAHPNLITLHELMSDDHQWFFTMELVDGVDFLAYVRDESREWRPDMTSDASAETALSDRNSSPNVDLPLAASASPVQSGAPAPRLNLDRVRNALAQLASGIDALHQAGKLHRDIKPSNVLVTSSGRVVLLDFGLVQELPDDARDITVAHESRVMGTPAYMAPERLRGGPVVAASDWYAVGVMLYEALTGRQPFTGSLVERIVATPREAPPLPSQIVAGIPPELDALCRDLLHPDPAERPTGADVRLRLGAGTGEPLVSPVPRRSTMFVGRTAELAMLDDAYREMLEGQTVVVLLHARPGVGKSALVRQFLSNLAERDSKAVILSGRCYEAESVPYKAVDSLIDALGHYLERLPPDRAEAVLPREVAALVRLFPALGSVQAIARADRRPIGVIDAQELRRRAFMALRELVGRTADRRPVTIVIDDLQWGDLDSAALLAEILRPPDAPPLLFVAAFRTEDAERAPMVVELSRFLRQMPSIVTREIALRGLDPHESLELATKLLTTRDGAATADAIRQVAQEAGGNPLFIGELTRYLQPGGLPRTVSSSGGLLEEVIRARVEALPAEAKQLLELTALIGQPVAVSLVARAAGNEAEDARMLALLRAARLIRGSGAGMWRVIEPYHDRIREVITQGLPPDVAQRHHLRIAEVLEATPDADPERRAFHFERGGAIDRAAPCLVAAGDQAAAALAFDRAAALYRRALVLRPPSDPSVRRSLEERLGTSLAAAGRGADAGRAFLDAARDAPRHEALDLTRRAAEQLLMSGHMDEGLDTLRMVLEAVGLRMAASPKRALLSVIVNRARIRWRGLAFTRRDAADIPAEDLRRLDACWTAAAGLASVDVIRSADFFARHLVLALRAGEPQRVARAFSNAASQMAQGGNRSRGPAQALMATADAMANQLGVPEIAGLNHVTAGIGEYLDGRWTGALTRLMQAEPILRDQCTGVAWELDNCHLFQLRTMYMLGQIRELCQRVPRLVEEAEERGDRLAMTMFRARVSSLAALVADAPARAREESSLGIAAWSQRGFHMEHYFDLMAQTETDLYCGNGAAAWERISTQWPAMQRSLLVRIQAVRVQSLDVRGRAAAAVAVQTVDAAQRAKFCTIAERDAALIEREQTGWGAGFAHGIRASVAVARGETGRAIEELDAAGRAFTAASMALHATCASRRLGVLTGGEAGRQRVADADLWLTDQTIRDPRRFTQMLGA